MTVLAEKIVAAAKILGTSGLRARLDAVTPNESHRVLPEIWPYILQILILVDAADQIAEAFRERIVDSETTNLLELPAFSESSIGVRAVTALMNDGATTLSNIERLGLMSEDGSRHRLRSRPNFGSVSMARVREAFRAVGVDPDKYPYLTE
jgi:hypothetical protein